MKKTILFYISDGHGCLGDRGAQSGRFDEFEINRKMCDALYRYLTTVKGRKYKVAYPERKRQMSTREKTDGKTDSMKAYRKKGYFVVGIELHMNSASGTNGDGAEVYAATWSRKGKKLANLVLNEWKAIGQNSRGIKHDNSLTWIKYGRDVAILTEFGFINNPVDRKIFDTDKEIRRAGRALGKACVKFAESM